MIGRSFGGVFLVLFLSLSTGFTCGGTGLGLAERGSAADRTIVISSAASPSVRYAAEELQAFVERMTGVRLPIATDSDPLPERAVLIGETAYTAPVLGETPDWSGLGEDGFRIVARPPHLLVVGSPKRGALFGTYELLEKYGGCRWYSSVCSKIPELDVFSVPSDVDDVQIPAFALREPLWYDLVGHHSTAARLKTNTASWFGMDEKFGGSSYRFGGGLACHTFSQLVPPAQYAKNHPEYYAMRDGRRFAPETGITQLCLSNPDVLELVVAKVEAAVESDPGARFFSVSQNDNLYYCQCPDCAAVDAEEGSPSGSIIRFVNAVADRIAAKHPNVYISTLAYTYSRTPPKKTKPRRNVVPMLCGIECDYAHSIATGTDPANVSYRNDLVGWAAICDELYVWDYVTNFKWCVQPFPNCYVLQENLQFFRDNHVREVFAEGTQNGPHAEFAELKAWLQAKWMWNPDLPREELLDDFFEGYYGKGAPYARQYFDELQRRRYEGTEPLGNFAGCVDSCYSDAFYEEASRLWALAEEAVRDDPVRLHNVRMDSFPPDFTRFMRGDRLLVFGKGAGGDPGERSRLARSLLDRYAESTPPIIISENAADVELVLRKLNEALTPKEAHVERGSVEERDFNYGYYGIWSLMVDDDKAEDGRAARLYNLQNSWMSAYFGLGGIVFEPGVEYTIRVRVRVDPVAGRSGEAFRVGLYDMRVYQPDDGKILAPSVAGMDAEYHWYEVTTLVPDERILWISVGDLASVNDVWIDKVEFVRVTYDQHGKYLLGADKACLAEPVWVDLYAPYGATPYVPCAGKEFWIDYYPGSFGVSVLTPDAADGYVFGGDVLKLFNNARIGWRSPSGAVVKLPIAVDYQAHATLTHERDDCPSAVLGGTISLPYADSSLTIDLTSADTPRGLVIRSDISGAGTVLVRGGSTAAGMKSCRLEGLNVAYAGTLDVRRSGDANLGFSAQGANSIPNRMTLSGVDWRVDADLDLSDRQITVGEEGLALDVGGGNRLVLPSDTVCTGMLEVRSGTLALSSSDGSQSVYAAGLLKIDNACLDEPVWIDLYHTDRSKIVYAPQGGKEYWVDCFPFGFGMTVFTPQASEDYRFPGFALRLCNHASVVWNTPTGVTVDLPLVVEYQADATIPLWANNCPMAVLDGSVFMPYADSRLTFLLSGDDMARGFVIRSVISGGGTICVTGASTGQGPKTFRLEGDNSAWSGKLVISRTSAVEGNVSLCVEDASSLPKRIELSGADVVTTNRRVLSDKSLTVGPYGARLVVVSSSGDVVDIVPLPERKGLCITIQ